MFIPITNSLVKKEELLEKYNFLYQYNRANIHSSKLRSKLVDVFNDVEYSMSEYISDKEYKRINDTLDSLYKKYIAELKVKSSNIGNRFIGFYTEDIEKRGNENVDKGRGKN